MPAPYDPAFPTTILSKPFLSIEPDASDEQSADRVVRGARSGMYGGAANTEVDSAPPIMRRTYRYHLTSREEIAAFRAFYRARKARAEAFWFIDWQMDFVVDEYFENDLFNLWIWTNPRDTSDGPISYGTTLFPLGDFYRHLMIVSGLRFEAWRITAVTSDFPALSGLERLTLQRLTSATFTDGEKPWTMARGYRPLWLRYGRFDSDTLSLEFHSSDEAIATLAILDLPAEVPT